MSVKSTKRRPRRPAAPDLSGVKLLARSPGASRGASSALGLPGPAQRSEPAPVKLPTPLRGVLLFTRYIRQNLSLDFPVNQVAMLLLVAGSGPAGATMADIAAHLRMSQSSTSKNIRALTAWSAPGSSTRKGHGLVELRQDLSVRPRRLHIVLTDKGRELVHVLEMCLSGNPETGERFDRPEDLPREVPAETYNPDPSEPPLSGKDFTQ